MIKLAEFKLSPNVGDIERELVVAASDLKPGKLPTSDGSDVDEDSLDVIGEVSERPPGKTGTTTLDLEPGRHVMFSNVPGHYAAGMYGSLTVK